MFPKDSPVITLFCPQYSLSGPVWEAAGQNNLANNLIIQKASIQNLHLNLRLKRSWNSTVDISNPEFFSCLFVFLQIWHCVVNVSFTTLSFSFSFKNLTKQVLLPHSSWLLEQPATMVQSISELRSVFKAVSSKLTIRGHLGFWASFYKTPFVLHMLLFLFFSFFFFFTKSALPSAWLVLLVHSYMWSTCAVLVQNLLFGTEYLVMWGVYKSSRNPPDMLTDSSRPLW